MRIGYISKDDPEDIGTWSGIHFHMVNALRTQGVEIELFGPLGRWHEYPAKACNYILKKTTEKKISTKHTFFSSRQYANELYKMIRDAPPVDLYFAPNASTELASLILQRPLVYLSGTTTQNMKNYYPNYSDLIDWSLEEADKIEQKAIARASKLIFPSLWAAKSAIQDYSANRDNVHVVPYGANIPDAPGKKSILKKNNDSGLNFLFIGKEWKRKGGPIALSALKKLREEGIQAKFTVVGCTLDSSELPEFVDNISFIDKKNPQKLEKMVDLYSNADFLFMPVRNECFGVVFSEAAVFGLPVISTNTGGVPTAVLHNKTGILLGLEATANDYAKAIKKLLNDKTRYNNMRRASRKRYENTLNWDVWAKSVVKIFKSTVDNDYE